MTGLRTRVLTVPRSDARNKRRSVVAIVIVLCALYLSQYVRRGWIPHDEGMIGQTAERAAYGQIPHVDFDESYTGLLTWLYAVVFRCLGVQLLWIRYAVLLVALGSILLVISIVGRFVGFVPALISGVLAMLWGVPNYFAGVPSWWNLGLALGTLAAFFRAVESQRAIWLWWGGVLAGLSVCIKQTGLYVVGACLLTVLFADQARYPICRRRIGNELTSRVLRLCVAAVAVLAVATIIRSHFQFDYVLTFVAPVSLSAGLLVADAGRRRLWQPMTAIKSAAIFLAGVCTPLSLFAGWYAARGLLPELLYGAFIVSQRRTAFAALELPNFGLMVLGVPVLAMAAVPAIVNRRWRSAAAVSLAAVFCLLPFVIDSAIVYQSVWQSARLLSLLCPIAAVVVIWRVSVSDPRAGTKLYALLSCVTCWSLVQYPFAAPIYFCYVAPLTLMLIACLAGRIDRSGMVVLLPAVALYGTLAVSSMNRTYIEMLGVRHVPLTFATPLGIDRADLLVSPDDAETYRRLVGLIREHAEHGNIYAGPDSPEVYFLAGKPNRSANIFEFLQANTNSPHGLPVEISTADLVVVNRAPHFSTAPSDEILQKLRQRFGRSERVGPFEVLW